MRRPALTTLLIMCTGIFLGRYINIYPRTGIFMLAGLCVILITGILARVHATAGQALVCLSILFSGILYVHMRQSYLPASHILLHAPWGTPVHLTAWMSADPAEKKGRTELLAQAVNVTYGDSSRTCSGRILLTVYNSRAKNLRYGDEFTLTAELIRPDTRRNPGGFDFRAYLAAKNIHVYGKHCSDIQKTGGNRGSLLKRYIVYPVRRHMIRALKHHMERPAVPMALAFLTGKRDMVSSASLDRFSHAGIMHVLAVSGLHVGFVLLFLEIVLGLMRLPRRLRLCMEIAGLVLFMAVTEIRPSIVRATVMAVLFLAGRLCARKPDLLNILGAAGLCLMILQPLWLFDTGFLLSFSAVFSIVVFYPRMKQILIKRNLYRTSAVWRYAADGIIVTFCVTLGTMPVTCPVFNRIALLSPLVNLIAIPAAGLIVNLGLLTIIFSCISPFIASVYGTCASVAIYGLQKLAAAVSSLSFSSIPVPSFTVLFWIVYMGLLAYLFVNRKETKKAVFMAVLIFANCGIWQQALSTSFSKLYLIQFDVGQGDAALLLFPRGRTMLIDGGNRTDYTDYGKRVIAPFLRKNGIYTIDTVIATHPHNDHIGGLVYILEHFRVRYVIHNGVRSGSPLCKKFFTTLEQRHIPNHAVTAPDSLTCFPGAKIYFLSPDSLARCRNNCNNTSVVTSVWFGSTHFLFMGDAEYPVENRLVRKGLALPCHILKTGHHGSKNGCTKSFLTRTDPGVALISVGRSNRYNHPSPQCLNRLRSCGISVLRTDSTGAVRVTSDGEHVDVLQTGSFFKTGVNAVSAGSFIKTAAQHSGRAAGFLH